VRTSTRMTLAAGAAVALGAAPLGAVFDEWRWLWYAWAAVATVVGAHLLARYLRLPALLVPVMGLAGLLLYLTAVFGTDGALFGLIPTPDSLQLLRAGLDEGFQNINDFATPVPTTTGLVLLTAGALGLTAVAVDIVAVTLRRPAASGLALLALYAVPVAVVLGGVPWVLFAISACGYLMLLLVEGRDRLLHWGRPVAPAGRSASAAAGPIAAPRDSDAPSPLTGQRIGAVAIALAVILPLMVPGLTGNALNRLGQSGSGDGSGNGTGPLNEFAALRGELRQGTQVQLMTVTTDLAQPQYLRTKVLDLYQTNGFSASSRSQTARVGQDSLPPPRNQPSGDQRAYTTQVTLTDRYDDDALPVYYAPTRLQDVGDDWRYDTDKATIRSDRRHGDLTYTVQGEEPTPSAATLAAAPALSNDERDQLPTRLTQLPDSLPKQVRDTATRVVRGAGATTPFQQAKAINDYFTDGKNQFTYSESTLVGNSGNVLVDFLNKRQGFCEQYSAAMAVMLRALDIPSRVVIGYTPGTKNDDGTWSVSNHDAHAWVEAYFSGIGWTYFDPTPLADGRTVAPDYAPRPQAADGPSSSASSGAAASAGATPNQIPQEDLNAGSSNDGLQNSGLVTPRRLLVAAIVLVVLLLLLLPAVVRLSSRRRRLRAAAGPDAGAAARAAWDEVVGSAADYGVPVPVSETPRGLARRLDKDLELDQDAGRGLRLVALAEERARYAARAGVDGDLPAAVRAVRRGLRGEAGRRRRWRATLLPPSTVRAARVGSAARTATASTALNRLGDSLRRPVTPRRRR
jgi:transglutaminase-like putative cysteine protease